LVFLAGGLSVWMAWFSFLEWLKNIAGCAAPLRIVVKAEARQERDFNPLHPFADGTDEIGASVAMEQWETSPLRGVVGAQTLGVDRVTFEDVIEGGEEIIKGADEFRVVRVRDLVEIANDPTDGLKFPFAGEAEETIVGGDVGEEGEGAATEGAVIALTTRGAEAGERDHAGGQIRVRDGATSLGVARSVAFVAVVTMPEIGRRLEILPFAFVRGRDGMADVATKRFVVRVVRRTFFAAVEFCDGRVEAVVESAQIGGI
jgi:hypothetical protein